MRIGHLPLSFGTASAPGQDHPKHGFSRSQCQTVRDISASSVQKDTEISRSWWSMTLLFGLACVKHKQKGFDQVGRDLHPHWVESGTNPELLKRNPTALIDQPAAGGLAVGHCRALLNLN
ncbi:uncharacterized [Tachysurus ichikawai]